MKALICYDQNERRIHRRVRHELSNSTRPLNQLIVPISTSVAISTSVTDEVVRGSSSAFLAARDSGVIEMQSDGKDDEADPTHLDRDSHSVHDDRLSPPMDSADLNGRDDWRAYAMQVAHETTKLGVTAYHVLRGGIFDIHA
jgi:hypothetical protein